MFNTSLSDLNQFTVRPISSFFSGPESHDIMIEQQGKSEKQEQIHSFLRSSSGSSSYPHTRTEGPIQSQDGADELLVLAREEDSMRWSCRHKVVVLVGHVADAQVQYCAWRST